MLTYKRVNSKYKKIADYLVDEFGMSFWEDEVSNWLHPGDDDFTSDFYVSFDGGKVEYIAIEPYALKGQLLQVLNGLKKLIGAYDFSILPDERSGYVKFYPDDSF